VTVPQIETRLGRKRGQWTAADVADLRVVFSSIQRRETTVDDEFPPERVTAAEIRGEKPVEAAKAGGEKWPEVPPIPGGEP
jgi:hypothetical protein